MLAPNQANTHVTRIHFRSGLYERAANYSNITTTYWPWQTLDELRPQLDIPAVNTGRHYNMPPEPYGIVFDDIEGLHALADERGHIMLTSGIEMPMAVYRGQTQEHQPCVPSLARLQHAQDQLLALCRNAAFEEVIGSHPFVCHCEKVRLFDDAPLCIDKQGLAQHYGLTTDLMDVTSNFEVASFFATCQWNAASRSYQPIKFATAPGVLYRLVPGLFVGMDQPAEFRYVGWQPLHRPEQQRAAALLMKNGLDFESLPTVQKVRFKHSAKVSVRIWKSFDEGRALFPADAAADLAEQARCLMVFTRPQLDQAWTKLDAWNAVATDLATRKTIEQSAGLAMVPMPVLSWDGLNVERDELRLHDQWCDVLKQVRYRMAAYAA